MGSWPRALSGRPHLHDGQGQGGFSPAGTSSLRTAGEPRGPLHPREQVWGSGGRGLGAMSALHVPALWRAPAAAAPLHHAPGVHPHGWPRTHFLTVPPVSRIPPAIFSVLAQGKLRHTATSESLLERTLIPASNGRWWGALPTQLEGFLKPIPRPHGAAEQSLTHAEFELSLSLEILQVAPF